MIPVVVATARGVVRGRTVDLAEGGMCCVVQQGEMPKLDEQVRVMIPADGVDFIVPATVARVLPGGENRPAFAVRFLDPNPAEKWLRKQVLHWQIAARKVADPR
jgi:c-di-GMP-binding flagellar brake protein YcgR